MADIPLAPDSRVYVAGHNGLVGSAVWRRLKATNDAYAIAKISGIIAIKSSVVAGVRFAISRGSSPDLPADYAVTNTSERVVNFVLSTAGQHRFWAGLR